jgi:hypothetical protein
MFWKAWKGHPGLPGVLRCFETALLYSTAESGSAVEGAVCTGWERANVPNAFVQAIQITYTHCYLTFKEEEHKTCVKTLVIRDRTISVSDANSDVTKVTIKDAPFELSDAFIVNSLKINGNPVEGSFTRGTIKGTTIMTIVNGTRYVQMTDIKAPIPNLTSFGDNQVRIFCDIGKTICKYCGLTDHPFYRYTQKYTGVKRCFICNSANHLKRDHPNPCNQDIIMCEHCGITGHTQKVWLHMKPRHQPGIKIHD